MDRKFKLKFLWSLGLFFLFFGAGSFLLCLFIATFFEYAPDWLSRAAIITLSLSVSAFVFITFVKFFIEYLDRRLEYSTKFFFSFTVLFLFLFILLCIYVFFETNLYEVIFLG